MALLTCWSIALASSTISAFNLTCEDFSSCTSLQTWWTGIPTLASDLQQPIHYFSRRSSGSGTTWSVHSKSTFTLTRFLLDWKIYLYFSCVLKLDFPAKTGQNWNVEFNLRSTPNLWQSGWEFNGLWCALVSSFQWYQYLLDLTRETLVTLSWKWLAEECLDDVCSENDLDISLVGFDSSF